MSKRKQKSTSKRKSNTKRFKSWKKLSFGGKVWRITWITILGFFGLSIFQVLFCAVFNPPITPLMITRFTQQLKDPDRPVTFKRNYVSLDHISQNLVNAVVVSEDGLYMYHHGFDVKQMKMAYIEGKKGRRQRGGSTISMQTAKNCFLPHKHSMMRKAFEAYYTTLIEAIWGKKRIMECYLNIIEFGDGIYGCDAASQHYFGHSAEHLTKREAALLAVCLPTPLRSNPGRPSGYLSRQASIIQGRMALYGRINLDAKREDLNQRYVEEMDEGIFSFVFWMLTDGQSLASNNKSHNHSSRPAAHTSRHKARQQDNSQPEVVESYAEPEAAEDVSVSFDDSELPADEF